MIDHRPLTNTQQVIAIHSEKEQVPITYVCTTELHGVLMDVFYRSTPHPEFGNRYFGISFRGDKSYIHDADTVEQLSFDCIEDNGIYYYSQHRHDFFSINGKFIDGGRDYTRTNSRTTPFVVINGKFERSA